jgi:hypothetical protein
LLSITSDLNKKHYLSTDKKKIIYLIKDLSGYVFIDIKLGYASIICKKNQLVYSSRNGDIQLSFCSMNFVPLWIKTYSRFSRLLYFLSHSSQYRSTFILTYHSMTLISSKCFTTVFFSNWLTLIPYERHRHRRRLILKK